MSSNLTNLFDQLGEVRKNTPDESHLALLAALRAARDADEADACVQGDARAGRGCGVSVIPLPFSDPPLTKNKVRRMHFRKEAEIRRQAIEAVRSAIRAAKVTPVEQAVVILHWRQPNNRRRDGDGADPTKALCIDALVLEGVLPDDSWTFVIHSGVTCHAPIPKQPGAMWLSINPVPEEAA